MRVRRSESGFGPAWVLAAMALAVALLLGLAGLQAQERPARLYRMTQLGAEVGRETYLRTARTIERVVVVPVVNLKLASRSEFDAAGRFVRFHGDVFNAAGDTARGSLTLVQDGDSLIETRRAASGASRTRTLRFAIDGVIPAQSIAVVAEAVERSAGRDTTLRMLPMGGDSAVAVVVRHRGGQVEVGFAGIVATMGAAPGSAIEIPAQRLAAAQWDGRDSLPPLAGLRRPAPDYSAPPGAHYTAEELRIPVRMANGDTFSLAGTLTLPAGARGPVPVVVTISGSGRQPRDEDLWPLITGYRPFREIAERLARDGIGVFRFADRGVDGSTGAETEATTEDHAEEVRQILGVLRARPDVNGRRMALLGHSEGGMIGPLVAAGDPRLAAVIIMAGPGKTGRLIIRDQLRRPIETAPGLSDSARAAMLGTVDNSVDEWAGMNIWTRWFADFDPLPTMRRLRMPVLILQGALDRQVSAGQADTLSAAIRRAGNRDVTLRIYPRLNHLFLPTEGDGSPAEYPGLSEPNLPSLVLDEIAGWLVRRLRQGSP
jgi:dienelactone hydrolase